MATNYKIVSAETSSDLEAAVSEQIDNGLTPIGGVGVNTKRLNPLFLQALALSSGGGGGDTGAKELVAAMYDYPENNPTSIAAWNLEPGYYVVKGTNVAISRHPEENHTIYHDTGDIFIKVSPAGEPSSLNQPNYIYTQNKNRELAWYHGDDLHSTVLTTQEVVDNCTTSNASLPLSAKQGKLLSDRISALEAQLNG